MADRGVDLQGLRTPQDCVPADGAAIPWMPFNAGGRAPVLVVCDHATRRMPGDLGQLGLDDWVLGISPFWHVPNVSVSVVDWSGLGWITLVTVFLLAVGTRGFRHRDLAVS